MFPVVKSNYDYRKTVNCWQEPMLRILKNTFPMLTKHQVPEENF